MLDAAHGLRGKAPVREVLDRLEEELRGDPRDVDADGDGDAGVQPRPAGEPEEREGQEYPGVRIDIRAEVKGIGDEGGGPGLLPAASLVPNPSRVGDAAVPKALRRVRAGRE